MTWKSKPLHVLGYEDINLNLINLFLLKLSFIPISVMLLQSWTSEVWCIQTISQCSWILVIGISLRRRGINEEVKDLATQSKKLLVERKLGTPECNRQNVHRNYWTRCAYLEPSWVFLDEVGLFHCFSLHMERADNAGSRHGWRLVLGVV